MSEHDHPKTNGGRMVKRGDTFDPECHRTSYRLSAAQAILRNMGIEQSWTHGPATRCDFGRVKHQCDYRCVCHWPEWVTGVTFDLAYQLACEVQTERGNWHRAEAEKARRERAAA